MTSASTDLLSEAKVPLGLRLRQIESVIVLLWRTALMLASVAAVMLSVVAMLNYGPQPLTTGFLTAAMVICMLRFEDQLKKIQHPIAEASKSGRHAA